MMFAMGFQLAGCPGSLPVQQVQLAFISYDGEGCFEDHFKSEALRFL